MEVRYGVWGEKEGQKELVRAVCGVKLMEKKRTEGLRDFESSGNDN